MSSIKCTQNWSHRITSDSIRTEVLIKRDHEEYFSFRHSRFPIPPSVEAAVAAFTLSRAPGIYKGEYLKELFRRYGDVEDAPPAPQLPEWCFDEDEGDGDVDDEGNAIGQDPAACSSGSAPGKRKKERLKVVSDTPR